LAHGGWQTGSLTNSFYRPDGGELNNHDCVDVIYRLSTSIRHTYKQKEQCQKSTIKIFNQDY